MKQTRRTALPGSIPVDRGIPPLRSVPGFSLWSRGNAPHPETLSGELRDRLSDLLLTALTIMLGILLFVIAPMQAAGVLEAHHFGIAFGLVLVAAVFIVSGSGLAVSADSSLPSR